MSLTTHWEPMPELAFLKIGYGGQTVNTGVKGTAVTAAILRQKLVGLSTIAASPDLARSVRVTKRPHATSHKFTSGIKASSKITFDVYMNPSLYTGLSEAGGLKEFTATLCDSNGAAGTGANDIVAIGEAFVEARLASDASAEIKSALEGLPNNIIPSVTVAKVDYTTADTNDMGTYGNAFHQSYSITFSSSSNSGDQNMLSCDATTCDHDGCANRKVGVAGVTYLHHDSTFGEATAHATTPGKDSNALTMKVPKVNFQAQGYFVMDIHRNDRNAPVAGDLSSGSAYVEWNTGSGVERAEFPVIATAATVETAMRGITGWSGVTVTSSCEGAPCDAVKRSKSHSYTVTFPSGYDDGGQTPIVDLVAGWGGNIGTDAVIKVHDQRFSNSLWLGDITGWTKVACTQGAAGPPKVVDICNIGTADSDATLQGEVGDNYKVSIVQFGSDDLNQAGGSKTVGTDAKETSIENRWHTNADLGLGSAILSGDLNAYVVVDNSKAFPTKTSQNTGHYFAVGSTVEVLDTTWDLHAPESDLTVVDNVYRSFKVLSHVANVHGQTFAKLDSTPTTASSTNYALKVTTPNSTVTERTGITVSAAAQEIQAIWAVNSNLFAKTDGDQFRIYINENKPNVEFTELLTGASTALQLAEAINSFSALSGPATVAITNLEIRITFAAIDGDVPQLSIVEIAGNTQSFSVVTLVEGWSLFAGETARLKNVQPGSIVNVTASELVSFTLTSWSAGKMFFAYDGHVGSVALDHGDLATAKFADNEVEAAINSIKDENGNAKFTLANQLCSDGTAYDGTADPTAALIFCPLPSGVDASKLEMFPAASSAVAVSIVRAINKNNNGKSFVVKRVVNNNWALGSVGAGSDATKLVVATNNVAPFTVSDEIKFTQTAPGTACAFAEGTTNTAAHFNYVYNYYRHLSSVVHAGDSTTMTFSASAVGAAATGCTISATRTTLVVDSVPDVMVTTSVGATITGPKGSCSVSETVKGTYESDVCSSRGACDGAAGLCTCHEGYSGEACETQTVLV